MTSIGPQCPLWHGQYLPLAADQPAQGAILQLQRLDEHRLEQNEFVKILECLSD